MQVRALKTADEFQRYMSFSHEVYRDHPCWVPPDPIHLMGLLNGRAPTAAHSRVQPFWVEAGGRILATLTSVVDEIYNRHWHEQMGHLLLFEALPDQDLAVQALFQLAGEWLRGQGCQAARLSFLAGWQLPLTIDAYDAAPTLFHNYNPAYYHNYVKNAGCWTERGVVQYQIQFTPELKESYQQMIAHISNSGVSLRSWDFNRLEEETAVFTDLYNETFAEHWGANPVTVPAMMGLTVGLKGFLVPEFTAFAEADGKAVGAVFSLPDLNQAFHLMRGKATEANFSEFQQRLQQLDHGILLIIGVQRDFRGRGINLALAARSYLAMIERGYRTASYTVVLDDNWPSRRTAEKLGAKVIRNFNVYRKDWR